MANETKELVSLVEESNSLLGDQEVNAGPVGNGAALFLGRGRLQGIVSLLVQEPGKLVVVEAVETDDDSGQAKTVKENRVGIVLVLSLGELGEERGHNEAETMGGLVLEVGKLFPVAVEEVVLGGTTGSVLVGDKRVAEQEHGMSRGVGGSGRGHSYSSCKNESEGFYKSYDQISVF